MRLSRHLCDKIVVFSKLVTDKMTVIVLSVVCWGFFSAQHLVLFEIRTLQILIQTHSGDDASDAVDFEENSSIINDKDLMSRRAL